MAEFEVAASCSNNAVRSIGRGYRYERNSADNPFSNSFLPRHVSLADLDFSLSPPARTRSHPLFLALSLFPSLSLSLFFFHESPPPPCRRFPSSSVGRFSIPRRASPSSLSRSHPLGTPSSLFLLRALGVEQPSFVLVSLSIRLPSSLRRVCSGAHLVPEVKRGGIVAPVVLGTTTSLLLLRRVPADVPLSIVTRTNSNSVSQYRGILYRSLSRTFRIKYLELIRKF